MDSLLINEGFPLLSFLIFFPLAGAVVLFFFSGEKFARLWTLAITIIEAIISIPLLTGFDITTPKYQFAEAYSWIPQWNINYIVGVDGISILLVLLSTLIMPLCVLASWKYIKTIFIWNTLPFFNLKSTIYFGDGVVHKMLYILLFTFQLNPKSIC